MKGVPILLFYRLLTVMFFLKISSLSSNELCIEEKKMIILWILFILWLCWYLLLYTRLLHMIYYSGLFNWTVITMKVVNLSSELVSSYHCTVLGREVSNSCFWINSHKFPESRSEFEIQWFEEVNSFLKCFHLRNSCFYK